MNLLPLSTSNPGGEGDFSAAWGPDDHHMKRAEGTAGGNASVRWVQKWGQTSDMNYPYLFTVSFRNWSEWGKTASSRDTHELFWNSSSRTHVTTLILHVRLVQHSPVTLPVTGSVSIPSTDNLALQAFVQRPHVTDIDGQLHLECQLKTQARGWRTTSHLESMAPRDGHNISPTKKQHIASVLSCRSSVAFLWYAHVTQGLTSQDF